MEWGYDFEKNIVAILNKENPGSSFPPYFKEPKINSAKGLVSTSIIRRGLGAGRENISAAV